MKHWGLNRGSDSPSVCGCRCAAESHSLMDEAQQMDHRFDSDLFVVGRCRYADDEANLRGDRNN